MSATRRGFLRNGALAVLGGGFLGRVDRVSAMQRPVSLTDSLRAQASGASEALFIEPDPDAEGPPPPADYDRLPLEWNKRTVDRFKALLADRDIEAFLVRNPLNTTYLTGYWHTTTERPEATFMNAGDDAPWFMYPGLDRDLVKSWWFGSGETYFDFHHAEGAFPNEGKVQQGEKVDLFEFLLEGIKRHGVQGAVIGVDGELYPSELAKAEKILPGVEFTDVSDILIDMRQVKTPEELALWRRSYLYHDRAHAFARDYVLTHGTDITDYEVGMATTLWINDQLYSDLDLADGAVHHGVKSRVGIYVRVGPLTAVPHPNQPYFNRIGRGMALQVAGISSIGGYGHENYRAYIIADGKGEFDPHMRKLWTVSRNCCDMQLELSTEGVTCSHVAYEIHKYQVREGVQRYVYHRPAHGAGVEGHQSPYIALGDYTMLRKNMCFSEEPGLYDPDAGCGFNWSDTIVVGENSGYRMSQVPYSEEWCWIRV
jgi:Xaa-Pro dipeptidase